MTTKIEEILVGTYIFKSEDIREDTRQTLFRFIPRYNTLNVARRRDVNGRKSLAGDLAIRQKRQLLYGDKGCRNHVVREIFLEIHTYIGSRRLRILMGLKICGEQFVS